MTDAAAGQSVGGRRPDLDWLRVLAILSLLPYHTALIFHADGWVIGDPARSAVLSELCRFFTQWRMPLMFFLSGIATWTALGLRAPGRFAAGRVRRLAVPLAAGVLVVLPPQLYYTSGAGTAGESFAAFYPRFLDAMFPDGGGVPRWLHLWFIVDLLLIDLLAFPLLLWLRRGAGQALVARATAPLTRPGAIFLLAVPLVAVYVAGHRFAGGAVVLGVADAPRLAYYATLYLFGFVLASSAALPPALERQRHRALVVGIVAYAALSICRTGAVDASAAGDAALASAFGRSATVLAGLNTWAWVLAAVGYARHHLNFENALLRYARDASYPTYLLHQAVIVLVGAQLVQLRLPVGVKFAVITAVSTAVVLAAYDVLVRRTNATRFLFGLAPLRGAAGTGGLTVGAAVRRVPAAWPLRRSA